MKRLDQGQIEVLRELVQERIHDMLRGEYVATDQAGSLDELREIRHTLEGMYHQAAFNGLPEELV